MFSVIVISKLVMFIQSFSRYGQLMFIGLEVTYVLLLMLLHLKLKLVKVRTVVNNNKLQCR